MRDKTLWTTYTDEQKQELFRFNEEYRQFLSRCKTERECVTAMVEIAEAAGYRDLNDVIAAGGKLKAGDKVYGNNRGKMLVLLNVGRKPIEQGMNILGAHIDSPRLDLKINPLYEDSGFAMFKTHYYGGIKKYQWVARPMAIHGVVAKKDGSVVNITVGEDPSDPVIGISDLLIHLAKDQMQKTAAEVITGEGLNLAIGSIPADGEEKEPVKKQILNLLAEKYGITEDDFQSAELEIVPAGEARDYGLDRSMLIGYGHDDRVCAYPSMAAQLAVADPETTSVTVVTDKEEIGSVGATGMHSQYFNNFIADVMNLTGGYCELKLRHALAASRMLSSDVSVGFDPNYPEVTEKNNTPFFGYGPVLNKYTGSRGKSGSNDATAEYIASLRRLFEEEKIAFQMGELGRVDHGGGGTIAYILANYSMDVIDVGVPVHSMHAPFEVVSKADVYETYRAYCAFLKRF